jgi:hypothetical protein
MYHCRDISQCRYASGRKAVRSPDSSGARIHPFHDHRHYTPRFVATISLTYNSTAAYTSSAKSNTLPSSCYSGLCSYSLCPPGLGRTLIWRKEAGGKGFMVEISGTSREPCRNEKTNILNFWEDRSARLKSNHQTKKGGRVARCAWDESSQERNGHHETIHTH